MADLFKCLWSENNDNTYENDCNYIKILSVNISYFKKIMLIYLIKKWFKTDKMLSLSLLAYVFVSVQIFKKSFNDSTTTWQFLTIDNFFCEIKSISQRSG